MSKSNNTSGVDGLLVQAQIIESHNCLSNGGRMPLACREAPVLGHHEPVNAYVIPQDPVASMSCTSVQPKPNVILVKKYEHAMTELRQGIICPRCQDICQPPLMSCPDGHLFCNECIKGLKKCEKCEHENLTNRQLVLEKVAMAMNWNCDFQGNGCRAILKLNTMKEHLAQCRYQKHSSCVLNECKHDVPLDKHAFVKHMKEVHKCEILNVSMNNNVSSKIFKTFFKVNDYLKQKIDHKKEFQTVDIIEIKDNFFCCLVLETMDTISFECYAIGDSMEKESGFHCYRAFRDVEKKCEHQSIDPVISITVGAKRKDRDSSSIFAIDKKKARFLQKSINDCGNVIECFMKIGINHGSTIHCMQTILN